MLKYLLPFACNQFILDEIICLICVHYS